MAYWNKMTGSAQSPPRVGYAEVVWSWIGSFLGIATVALLHYNVLDRTGLLMIIGSFGASAVIVYGAIRSPLAQPRNLVGGHVLSAIVGVAAFQLLGQLPWLAAALAVSSAIALMHLTKTLHPPGGATALIAVIDGDAVHGLGFQYALIPAGLGAGIFGFVINLPIINYYEHGTYLTMHHGHTAMFGTYGMLSISLLLFSWRGLISRDH
jgi:CBS-domain-containing membrane protein